MPLRVRKPVLNSRGDRSMKADEVLEEIDWLLNNGASVYEVQDALGKTWNALLGVLRRAGRLDLARQFDNARVFADRHAA